MTTELARLAGAELAPIFDVPADRNPALIYLAELAQGSRRTMRHALDVIAEVATGGACNHENMPWGALRAQHVTAIRAALAEGYSYRTANKFLSALRGTLRAALAMARLAAQEAQARALNLDDRMSVAIASQALQDALQDAIAACKAVAGESTVTQAEAGRAVTLGELGALMAACAADPSAAGARDAAIVAVLRVAGLRRAEVAGLNLEDYDPLARRLTVRGKRNKSRVIPIEDPGAVGALADWLHVRGTGSQAQPEGCPLFTRIDRVAGGGHTVTAARLTDQGIYYILAERQQAAGVTDFTPHDLRRTFAGDLLDSGADLVTVQRLMGHSNPTTTAGYDRRGEGAKRKAVAALQVPYKRRYSNGGGGGR